MDFAICILHKTTFTSEQASNFHSVAPSTGKGQISKRKHQNKQRGGGGGELGEGGVRLGENLEQTNAR